MEDFPSEAPLSPRREDPLAANLEPFSLSERGTILEGEYAERAEGTVLIADDDVITRVYAREALEQIGLTVAETSDAAEAYALFDDIAPDLILLNVQMPGLDGFTLCRQIREHPEGWNVPILVMTSLDDLDSIKRAYELGATDFVAKPCNFLVLGYRVRYMLRSSRTLKELSKSRASLNHAQHLAQIGSWEWDVKNDVLHWSESIFRIFDVDPFGFDKTYHSFLNSVDPLDRGPVNSALRRALSTRKALSIDHQIVTSDGKTRYVHTEAKVTDDRHGRPVLVTGTVQDITERKQYEEMIRKLAYFDSLTGLPNRVMFKENLAQALSRAEERSLMVAAIFLDMDHFKEINDTLGHDVGDLLLQEFAQRLARSVRRINRFCGSETDPSRCAIARLGGDEFTVILDDLHHPEEAALVANRIISTMIPPFDLDGREISITVSIGISMYPDDGTQIMTLLKNADIAMYRAKALGRNNYCFYSTPYPPDPQ